MIAIVKYGSGNIRSLYNALLRLGVEAVITDDEMEIWSADRVIIPGVGDAGFAMKVLREKKLDIVINSLKQPVLGICLGMQLMCTRSEEGQTDCLNIIPAEVRRFPPLDRVPHTGWDNFCMLHNSELLNGISIYDDLYYVHSYYADITDHTLAACSYIVPFSAVIQKDNFWGVQFHPEKSGDIGLMIIKNFLEL